MSDLAEKIDTLSTDVEDCITAAETHSVPFSEQDFREAVLYQLEDLHEDLGKLYESLKNGESLYEHNFDTILGQAQAIKDNAENIESEISVHGESLVDVVQEIKDTVAEVKSEY